MKSEVERQRELRSIISSGESLVRRGRSWSFLSRSRMWLRQSAMGTEGKRAAASKETIFSLEVRVRFLIFSTKENEFFITYGLFIMNGWRIWLRKVDRASWGAPIWDVTTRMG